MNQRDIETLRQLADEIMKVDGDRDYMNRSDLNVTQTVAAAKALRICADELEQKNCMLAALKGVVAVADRKTVEFDAARAAIAKAERVPSGR